MKRLSTFRAGALAAWIALVCCGCGAYGFSSSLLPAHIKTVAVPLFENASTRGDLSTALADSLTEALIDDHTLRVVSERDADSVIEGKILEYKRDPYTVDTKETVLQYKIEIVLEARFVDLRNNQVIWEEARLSQWDTYNFTEVGGQPAETEEAGIGRALTKMTRDILNRTVEGW
jgi:hypothetical protein